MSYKSLKEGLLLTRPNVKAGYDEQRNLNRLGLNRLGGLLQRTREHLNLTQQQIAQASGIAQADISRLEAGVGARGPTVDTLVRIAHAQRMKLIVELVPEDQPDDSRTQRFREAF